MFIKGLTYLLTYLLIYCSGKVILQCQMLTAYIDVFVAPIATVVIAVAEIVDIDAAVVVETPAMINRTGVVPCARSTPHHAQVYRNNTLQ